MFEPRPRILFRVQTGNRRHSACSQAVAIEHAHAGGTLHGPSGFGVEQMAVLFSFKVNAPGIVTTRCNGCI